MGVAGFFTNNLATKRHIKKSPAGNLCRITSSIELIYNAEAPTRCVGGGRAKGFVCVSHRSRFTRANLYDTTVGDRPNDYF